jgi:putative OPT family oligopeptide transporter
VSHPGPPVAEATARAIGMGVLFGALFGAANAYLGLRVGLTVATSIPVAVMTVATLRAFGARASILEANLAQTIGSASTSLATGAIFTLPALWMWGMPPSYLQIVGLALCGGILGVSAMIPLRRMLIVRADAELPYPEGRACAEVLRATSGDAKPTAWIFYGLGAGFAIKLLIGLVHASPGHLTFDIPGVNNAQLGLEVAPALIAVGYILGHRYSSVVFAGGLVAALALAPLATSLLAGPDGPIPSLDSIRKGPVRFIGIGAVALAGFVTVGKMLPAMTSSLLAVLRGMGAKKKLGAPAEPAVTLRTDRDVPGWVIGVGILVVITLVVLVPGVLAGDFPIERRLLLGAGVVVIGLVFVAVASRIVGLIGVTSQPTSGITLITLLALGGLCTAMGWTSDGARFALLTAATVVATAASKAGDISQDLKTGYLVGATPRTQQLGQYLGAATACWAVAATLLFIGQTAKFGEDPAAPQATLMKTVIEGQLAGNLPWDLVLAGAGLALAGMIAGLQGLAFAIGIYLPIGALAPIFLGGLLRRWVDGPGAAKEAGGNAGILAASGMVAGEGLAGVVVAALRGAAGVDVPKTPHVDGIVGKVVSLVIVGGIGWLLVKAGRSDKASAPEAEVAATD